MSKSGGSPLWLHSFTVWAITAKLAARIPRFTIEERRLLELAALIHDIGKRSTRNQAILRQEKGGPVLHTATPDDIETELRPLMIDGALALSKSDIKTIWEFVLHHGLSEKQLKAATTPAFGLYSQVIRWADWLASMAAEEHLDFGVLERVKNGTQGVLDFTTVSVGRFPSPTTYLIIDKAVELYRQKGWEPLLILDDAVIFVGRCGLAIPEHSQLIERAASSMREETLRGYDIKIQYMRYEILSGEARKDPAVFLGANREHYEEILGDIEKGPVLFFRTLMDLYKHSGQLTSTIRKTKPIVDILIKAGGTKTITEAKEEWAKHLRIPAVEIGDVKVNEMVADIFFYSRINDVLEKKLDNCLISLKPTELFDLLLNSAEEWFPEHETDISLLANIVVMEEQTNFVGLARKCLERYKEYKEKRRPSYAQCEQCGAYITVEAKPSLNFPDCVGFTQINPRTRSDAPRSVCPLCVFDAIKLRAAASGKNAVIYARITSPIPDLWKLYEGIKRWTQKLSLNLINIQQLKRLDETPEFADWPLPRRFPIPILNKEVKNDKLIPPVDTERGVLIPLDVIKADNPKDLKARYLALYALLNGMGFTTHIGREEQTGLFGEEVFSHFKGDWNTLYHSGLCINILAAVLKRSGKKANPYTFARNIMENSPPTMFAALEGGKLKKDLFVQFFRYLLKSKSIIVHSGKGDFTMKELLEDAAFFAREVPMYFWTGDDYKSWRNSHSRYVITKPVDRALNAFLQGVDFDEAFAQFLSLLKMDIAKDKQESKKGAKVDQNDLGEFVEKSRIILKRYADLKEENISRFIKAKNALRSAIHIIKRYEILQEVIHETA